jgi:hypothetical protein
MPKLLFNGDDPIPAQFGREGKKIEIELCRTELEQLLRQMNEFPFAPNWVAGSTDKTFIKIHAVDNFGKE